MNVIVSCYQHHFCLTVEDGGRVVEKGIGGEEEQVGAVGPRHGVEDQLPRTLWHLGSIFGHQPAPLSKRLQRHERNEKMATILADVFGTTGLLILNTNNQL